MYQKCINLFRIHAMFTMGHVATIFWHCWKLSRLFRNFPDCRETFQTLPKLSRLFENFPDWPENVFKVSRLIGNFPGCLETFQTVQKLSRPKLSRLSQYFPDFSEIFQTVWNISMLSINYPACPETFQTVWNLSSLFGNFKDWPENVHFVHGSVYLELFQDGWKVSVQSGRFMESLVNFVNLCKNFPGAQKLSGQHANECKRCQ